MAAATTVAMVDDALAQSMAYAYARKHGAQQTPQNDRSSFIPAIVSPGPAAYNVNTKESVPRTHFGTSTRDHEERRFISSQHSKSMPSQDSPAPGTYRVARSMQYERNPLNSGSQAAKFGTSPQRLQAGAGGPGCDSPGPAYNPPTPKDTPCYSFAPQGGLQAGFARSRDDGAKLFISELHSKVEPSSCSGGGGTAPHAYDVDTGSDAVSTQRRPPSIAIGRASRDKMDSLPRTMAMADPSAGTAATTPGAKYDVNTTCLSPTGGATMGRGPRSFSPDLCKAGPYVSKVHEKELLGAGSPGPAAYTLASGMPGNGNAPVFGALPASEAGELIVARTNVPGPGAYKPKDEHLSHVKAGSSYSIASCIRTDFAAIEPGFGAPGPGAYNVSEASEQDSKKPASAAYTMGRQDKNGRTSFIKDTCTPGPVYLPDVNDTSGNGRGFSLGAKEKTRNNGSSHRYLGPLHAHESLGVEGPGPVYDTSAANLSGSRSPPRVRMPVSRRETTSKVFISRQHSQADGQGLDSPGPGMYDSDVDVGQTTSKFERARSATFSTSDRFKSNVSTF